MLGCNDRSADALVNALLGPIPAEVNARQTDGSVEVSVSVIGIGIAPADQPTIFEEFRQMGGDYAHTTRRNWTWVNGGQEVC